MTQLNVESVRKRIASACLKAQRQPEEIILVAVSKGRNAGLIKEAVEAGVGHFGENRIQEAKDKFNQLSAAPISWHFVGHLQANKVKDAVRIFDLIHSADSIRLCKEIDKEAKKISKIQDILIQVNTSGEATKYGFDPDQAAEALKEISQFKNVNIKGFMTIAPIVDDSEQVRPYFRALRELRDELNRLSSFVSRPSVLSMGMSADFEVAIEEGATMVRLGRVIFD